MATYDITTQTVDPSRLKTKDIINCPYSGAMKSIGLPSGEYKLEVWGAQGGNYNSSNRGGAGGYSHGNLILTNELTTIYFYAGGQPSEGSRSAGWNGGGGGAYGSWSGTYSYLQGGGGGTDLRIGQDSLYARVIVAGGGGGSSNWGDQLTTRYGGGLTGGAYNSTYQATQTSGNAFGTGQSGYASGSYRYGSAGSGGGWYGGKSYQSYSDSSNYYNWNSGGSGYVYTAETASSYPSGCLLNSAYYLLEAETIGGNQAFLSPAGETETGHIGNGYCRITVIKIGGGAPSVKLNGEWKEGDSAFIKINNSWKEIDSIYCKLNNNWKELG